MDPNEYQKFTRTTAIYPNAIERQYLVLGLMSETVELLELMKFEAVQGETGRWLPSGKTAFEKEAGDISWYVARLADAFGLTLQEIVDFAIDFIERSHVKSHSPKADCDEIILQAGKLCGVQKKVLRDDEGNWTSEKGLVVMPALRIVMLNLSRLLHTYGSNLETVLELNYQKLTDRQRRNVLSGSGDER